jgi:DNA-binding MarR family transcriptional regulator
VVNSPHQSGCYGHDKAYIRGWEPTHQPGQRVGRKQRSVTRQLTSTGLYPVSRTLIRVHIEAEGGIGEQAIQVSDEADSDALLASSMRTCIMRLARQLRAERGDETLSFAQHSALAVIESRGPISPGKLAAFERVQPPSMTRIITVLCNQGYIERSSRPDDRRHALLSTTQKGRELIRSDRERRSEWLTTILKTLTPLERSELRAALPHLERLVRTGIEDHISEVLR